MGHDPDFICFFELLCGQHTWRSNVPDWIFTLAHINIWQYHEHYIKLDKLDKQYLWCQIVFLQLRHYTQIIAPAVIHRSTAEGILGGMIAKLPFMPQGAWNQNKWETGGLKQTNSLMLRVCSNTVPKFLRVASVRVWFVLSVSEYWSWFNKKMLYADYSLYFCPVWGISFVFMFFSQVNSISFSIIV